MVSARSSIWTLRERKTTWKEFLTQHWELIVAADFFSVEAWTGRGLQRFLILFFMELSTRRVEIAGIASHADGLCMSQIGRNLTDSVEGLLKGKRYLVHDRDPLFNDGIPEDARRCGRCLGEASTAQPQFERARGTICTHDQGILPGANDLVR